MLDARALITVLIVAMSFAYFAPLTLACENCDLPTAPPPGMQQPAGAPQGAPSAAPQGLPQGHPPISQPATTGTIVVRAVQGTPDGDPIGNAEVVVTLQGHGHGQSAQQADISTRLDEHGVAMIEDVEFRGAVQPVIAVHHAGVVYRTAGPVMSAQQPDQIVRITVYDVTDEAPDWQVGLRHLFLQPTPDGVIVDEVMVINNPADRAWIATAESAGDRPATLTLPLPAGARNAQLARGPEDMAVVGQSLVMHGAMVPGRTEIGYRYILPIDSDVSQLTLTAPAVTKRIMLFIPDDGSEVTAQGLEPGQTMDNNGQRIRVFKSTDVEAGAPASIRIKPNRSEAAASRKIEISSSGSMRNTAAMGGLALVAAAAVMFLRTRRASDQTPTSKDGK